VTASDIAEAISARTGSSVDHRQVVLDGPIKEIGSFQVPVTLTRNVRAEVTIEVQAED
jgi:large subunit ribosomal protein L9